MHFSSGQLKDIGGRGRNCYNWFNDAYSDQTYRCAWLGQTEEQIAAPPRSSTPIEWWWSWHPSWPRLSPSFSSTRFMYWRRRATNGWKKLGWVVSGVIGEQTDTVNAAALRVFGCTKAEEALLNQMKILCNSETFGTEFKTETSLSNAGKYAVRLLEDNTSKIPEGYATKPIWNQKNLHYTTTPTQQLLPGSQSVQGVTTMFRSGHPRIQKRLPRCNEEILRLAVFQTCRKLGSKWSKAIISSSSRCVQEPRISR